MKGVHSTGRKLLFLGWCVASQPNRVLLQAGGAVSRLVIAADGMRCKDLWHRFLRGWVSVLACSTSERSLLV